MSLKKASSSLASRSRVGFTPTGGGAAVTISNIIVTDSSWNNLDDTAVGTSSSYIKIIGSGFVVNPSVYIGTTQVSSGSITFVSSTELRVVLPSLSLGTQNLFVFNTDYSGAIWSAGLVVSGFPDYTQTTYTSSTPLSVSVQLLATGDAPLTYALQGGSSLPAGTSLSSSGLITGTTTDGTYQFTVIVSDAQNQSFQQQLTLTITSADQYFNRTVLAINADTDTFVRDASSNNFAITVNGDTKPSAFSPYNTNWSNFFDGTGDKLSLSSSTAFGFGTGDFTIELWVFCSFNGAVQEFIDGRAADDNIPWVIGINGTGLVRTYDGTTIRASGQLTQNAWNHVAWARVSNVNTVYLNGVSVQTWTASQDFGSTKPLTIANNIGPTSEPFTGYISNLRIVKGTAVYTSAFTSPTSALTAIANTSLLTCQSNRLIDNSTNAFTITKNGDTKVSAFGPFTETDTTTGSAYFDGTGDYLRTTSQTFSGNFTLECWIYPLRLADSGAVGEIFGTVSPNTQFYVNSDGRLGYYNTTTSTLSASNAISINRWQHVAICRSGTTTRLFVNGQIVATNSSDSGNRLFTDIGTFADGGSYYFQGYISNVRWNATDLYTSSFTPPTSPLTAVSNTSLLTLQGRRALNNHTFIDGSENSLVVTRGGNTSQGSFSPFSPAGWSNYFDGTGDYLTVPGNAAFQFPGDLTIEAWIIWDGTYSESGRIIYGTGGAGSLDQWGIFNGTIFFAGIASSTSPPINRWVHLAVTRSGSTIRHFIDGVASGSGTVSSTIGSTTNTLYIGFRSDGYHPWYGYISNFRIIKGTALYTSAFTPPTAPLTAVANTSLLTCQSNRFIDNSTNNFTITKNGDTKVVNFSPFAPTAAYSPETHGASAYFDGTGDYLTLASNVLPDISGAFTYECWIYPINGSAAPVFGTWNNNTGGWGLFLSNTTASFNGMSIFWYFGNYGTGEAARGVNSNAMITNAWNHIAVVRNASNVWAFYVNGIERGTTTFGVGSAAWSDSRNFTDGNPVGIGQSNGTPKQSYISDARLVIGNAVYTANFTPPSAPLTKIGGTNLLLNFNSGGIIDSTSRNVLECVGDVKIVTSIRKYGTGSMSFDGTGDYLQAPNSTIANFESQDFTIEFWMYASSQALAPIVHQTSYASNLGWIIWNYDGVSTVASTRKLSFMLNGGAFVLTTPSDAYTNNTWTHIAVVKNGTGSNNIKIYSNGSQIAAGTYSTALNNATQPLMVGGIINGVSWNSTNYYNGYLDDLRITRFARYTANFTPPTSTFLAQ